MIIIIRLITIGLCFLLINNLTSFACQDRIKTSSVKSNMLTLQTMIKTYAVDWKGFYPKTIGELKREAVKNNYWKSTKNPYNSKETLYITSNINEKNLDLLFINKNNYFEGTILYSPLIKKNSKLVLSYKIYGIIKTYPSHASITTHLNDFLNYINIFSYTTCGPPRTDYFSVQINDFIREKEEIWYLTNQ